MISIAATRSSTTETPPPKPEPSPIAAAIPPVPWGTMGSPESMRSCASSTSMAAMTSAMGMTASASSDRRLAPSGSTSMHQPRHVSRLSGTSTCTSELACRDWRACSTDESTQALADKSPQQRACSERDEDHQRHPTDSQLSRRGCVDDRKDVGNRTSNKLKKKKPASKTCRTQAYLLTSA